MTRAVVFTPQAGLGELLRESLASRGVEATVLSEIPVEATPAEEAPALLVVDGDVAPPEQVLACANAFRQRNADLRVVLLAPEATVPPALTALAPDLTLPKPFYLPDFLAAVAGWFGEAAPLPAAPPARALPPRPPWLSDVAMAAQYLTRLSLETAAQAAALVTTDGQLWAYAGELPQPAAEELARLAAHYWEAGEGVDFVRFLRLEAVQQDYLLYATGVTADLVLAMLFDVRVPFSRIRAQAGHLAEALTRDRPPGETETPASSEAPPARHLQPPPLPEDALPLPDEPLVAAPPAESTVVPAAESAPAEAVGGDLPPEAYEPLFDEVPPPEPPTPPPPAAPPAPQEAVAPVTPGVEVAEAPLPAASSPLQPQPSDTPEATLPAALPIHAAVAYACVLIPRFPQHRLAGDLARDLSQWLPQIATAMGWRLVHLAVRADHLQWIAQTPPETSPAEVLRTVRRETSRRIFATYPRLAELNISGDFWAPGYLLLSQNRPIAADTIAAFIAAARRHQGLTP